MGKLSERATTALRKAPDKVSLVVMIMMNLLPLAGALFAGWEVGFILIIYWAENLVVGVYNVLKFSMVQSGKGRWDASAFPLIPFFIVHYGMFCLVHGVFVMVLTNRDGPDGPLSAFKEIGSAELIIPILALVVSHGVSFAQNYVLRGEYKTATPSQLMLKPYGRIVVLHVVILFGGFVTMALNSPLPILALLIILKIGIDVVLHTRSHLRAERGRPGKSRAGDRDPGLSRMVLS